MKELRLEKYRPADFELYARLVADDELMKYITGSGLSKDQACKKFTAILKQGTVNADLGYFKVYDAASGVLLGDCKLVYYPQLQNALEIGYLLKKEFQQKGIGTQICAQLIATAKENFPNFQIIAIIDPDNTASRKLLEKFRFESYWKGMENHVRTEKLRLAAED